MANAFGSIGDNGKLLLTMISPSVTVYGLSNLLKGPISNSLKGPMALRKSNSFGRNPGHVVHGPQA